jgi:hypothetical protein
MPPVAPRRNIPGDFRIVHYLSTKRGRGRRASSGCRAAPSTVHANASITSVYVLLSHRARLLGVSATTISGSQRATALTLPCKLLFLRELVRPRGFEPLTFGSGGMRNGKARDNRRLPAVCFQ